MGASYDITQSAFQNQIAEVSYNGDRAAGWDSSTADFRLARSVMKISTWLCFGSRILARWDVAPRGKNFLVMPHAGADRGFAFLTIREAARLLRARKVSSLELANDALARIERLNPQLNAFITVTAELARKQARTADREIRAGKHRGLLHGVPVTIKDNCATRGIRTTAGSKILRDYVPDRDAAVVARLREAGAVFLGKTNLNEFAYGIHGLNPHYGDVHNPWSLDRTTGGSSSGSAAALAAGIGFGSVGTDTGGSLRIPASFCGIVGFKPSFGLVSVDGIVPLAKSLDHAGPLARTVDDAAILFGAIREKYERRMRGDAALRTRPLKIKLGWPANYFFDLVDPEVQSAIEAAVKLLESIGARVGKYRFLTSQNPSRRARTSALPRLRAITRAADIPCARGRLQ